MNRGSAEAIKAALRRSLPLIVALIVFGAVAMNAATQLRGPRYEASARVLLTTSDVTSLLTGTQPVFIDPDQVHDMAVALASSPELYERVARQTKNRYGTAEDLRAATKVGSKDNNVVGFTASTSEPERSQAIANAVADEYLKWRASIAGEQVNRA